MSADDLTRLRHMLDAAREAVSFVQGRSRDDLHRDRMLLLSLVKELEIVGEAAGRISPEGKAATPGIPWDKVTAMRNRLTHGYFDWSLEIIWATVTTNLPDLIRELERVLPPEN